MPKRKEEVRFAVGGTRDDMRSSVWRLWANGDELYLAPRFVAAIAKISFHKSGINRIAACSDIPRPAIQSWQRRADLAPGWNRLFAMMFPPRVSQRPLR